MWQLLTHALFMQQLTYISNDIERRTGLSAIAAETLVR